MLVRFDLTRLIYVHTLRILFLMSDPQPAGSRPPERGRDAGRLQLHPGNRVLLHPFRPSHTAPAKEVPDRDDGCHGPRRREGFASPARGDRLADRSLRPQAAAAADGRDRASAGQRLEHGAVFGCQRERGDLPVLDKQPNQGGGLASTGEHRGEGMYSYDEPIADADDLKVGFHG